MLGWFFIPHIAVPIEIGLFLGSKHTVHTIHQSFFIQNQAQKLFSYCSKCIVFPFLQFQDESHFLKNSKTARCRAAMPLLKVSIQILNVETVRPYVFKKPGMCVG